MLGKLIRYDFKSNFKFLMIFYILSLFFAVLTRIFLNIEDSFILNIIGQICSGATIAMMFNILINNLMRTWVRFRHNLYGDESYLTHTLPVERKTIYSSKFITSIILVFISMLVISLTIFIAYYSKENLKFLKDILLPVVEMIDSTMFIFVLMFVFILFLEIFNLLQIGFTGIILGHKMNNNKVLYSVIYGFVSYSVIQVIVFVVLFVVALFNKDMLNLFFTNEIINMEMVKFIIILAIFIYSVSIIGVYFVNQKLLSKGVNVD